MRGLNFPKSLGWTYGAAAAHRARRESYSTGKEREHAVHRNQVLETHWRCRGARGAVAWSGTGLAQLGGLPGIPPLPGVGGGGGGSTPTGLVGEASAVTAVVLGSVTQLASTGTLTAASDPLGTGQGTGSIPGLLSAEALHAVTMGWTDQVASEASLANLAMTVAGTGISAETVLSRAFALAGAGGSGLASVEGLNIGGLAITPTGLPNEQIWLLGLSITLNEQIQTASGIVVNALRVRTLDGLTDVVVGSARAGI